MTSLIVFETHWKTACAGESNLELSLVKLLAELGTKFIQMHCFLEVLTKRADDIDNKPLYQSILE